MGKSGLIGRRLSVVVAEGVAAVQAVVVIQIAFIDDLTDLGTGRTACCTAQQGTDDGAGNTANADSDGADDDPP